jgi:ABC-type Na+ efflux pump permease subunit
MPASPILSIAKKDLRLVWRDRRALIVLLVMPLAMICVLGLSLGEGFGQKSDDRLRISVVDLDEGFVETEPNGTKVEHHWSKVVEQDLAQTAGIRVELIASRAEAEGLVRDGRRAAVLVFGPTFSRHVTKASFMTGGVNPFDRDGVRLKALDLDLLEDPTQLTAASIIDQVAQVTAMRVVMPWMIGRAFEKVGEKLGPIVQGVLKQMFPDYDLTGKTWAALTRSQPRQEQGAEISAYQAPEGGGLLNRGAMRYQILVPAYLVMFAYFLVLTAGRLFVAERQEGTMKRLRAAPLSRWEILWGKFIPCFVVSVGQGLFLLIAGKLVFAMSWGPQPWWLLAVVVATSLSAMGLALIVAALARTESQVTIYGTLLVLVLAGVSGCLMGDRELMPEAMQQVSLVTPHAWALVAYRQLLANQAGPNLSLVIESCGVLTGYGIVLILIAWRLMRLDDAR